MLAAGGVEATARSAALDELCNAYWFPLYAYLRRSGESADGAAEIVQQFFVLLLSRNDLKHVDPQRGRFRSWLLTALRNFTANERERARALKRGGGRAPLSFDADRADAQYASAPLDPRTPEQAFERAWANSVLKLALARLAAEQEGIGRTAHFEALLPALTEQDDAAPHAEAAARLGVTENSLKVALHRLRKRLGELVREEVAGTLADPSELQDELRVLFRAFATPQAAPDA